MQNFIKTIINSVQSWTKKQIKNSTADWSQNDSSADNYIKNRTHWEEGKEVVILPEMTVFIDSDGGYETLANPFPVLTIGDTYIVVLNGVRYRCVARRYNDSDALLGNGTIYGDDDEGNGEPFSIDSYDNSYIYLNVAKAGTYTVSIFHDKTVIHKLDFKYLDLPENIATTDDVQDALDAANEAYQIADNAIGQLSAEENARIEADTTKMNKDNPVGTGSFSMNRLSDSEVGQDSSTLGTQLIANKNSLLVNGKYNIAESKYMLQETKSTKSGGASHSLGHKIDSFTINDLNGLFNYTNKAALPASYDKLEPGMFYFSDSFKFNGVLIQPQKIYEPIEIINTTTDTYGKPEYTWKMIEYTIVPRGGTYAHIVGNGTSDTDRSNAHTLDWDGNAWYAGDVYVSSTSGTNKDEGSKKLATEEFVSSKIAEAELGGEEVDLSGYALKSELPSRVSQLQNDSGYITGYTETDPTVPAWAKASTKPSYTASEVGALPNDTKIPAKLSDLTDDSTHRVVTDTEKSAWNAKSNFSGNYNDLSNKPTIPSISGLATETYVDNKIAAIPTPDVSGQIDVHNTSANSHNDIRLLVEGLTTRLNTLANSDDTTLDQMNEIVTYIKNNKNLIDSITTGKVNVSDIINNLTTNVANKPLSAAQGVALKALIDNLNAADVGALPSTTAIPSALADLNEDSNHRTVTDVEKTTWNAKADITDIPTKISELTNDSGFITSYTETDPTVPSWAKASTKPSYTKNEVGLGNVDNVKQYSASNPPPYPVTSVNGKTGAVTLDAAAVGARPSTWMPSASDVGADSKGTASSAVSAHNTATDAHNDIRLALKDINDRLNAFFDSDDKTLDELSEIVTYITSNKALIDSITTSKVSVSDIINNLTTNVSNKPLSAAQGVALKGLIDTLNSGKLDASALSEAINTALAQAKASGEFDGEDGQRGTGLLSVTTAPSSYTTAVGGITPKYRMAISTIKTQAVVTEVLLGDTVRYSYYHYPIDYLDASYAYFTERVSIRGATGADGQPGVPGADGNDGYTPVRGVDYYTEAEKAEWSAYIATELAKRGQLEPMHADSIDKCTDTTKLYVLPDGMIYAYMLTEKEVETGGGYTNALDGVTININKRWSHSSKGLSSADGYATMTIPVTADKKVYVNVPRVAFLGNYPRIHYLDASNNYVTTLDRLAANAQVLSTEDGVTSWTTGYQCSRSGDASTNARLANADNIAKMVLVLNMYDVAIGNDGAASTTLGAITEADVANLIVSIGNPIEEGGTTIVKEYAWASTGHAFVPADYEERIIAVENAASKNTARIVALEKSVESGGADETEKAALDRIQKWDKPVYDPAPVTLIADDRVKPALTTNDRTIPAIYAKYRALMAAHPDYITETNMGKSSASSTFTAVDMLRFDFCEPGGLTQPDLADSARHETKPTLIFLSGIHTEWVGVWGLYYALEEIATNPDFDDIRRNAHIVVIPCANPFCLTSQTAVDGWRMSHVNANGVAIHNNFGVNHSTSGAVGEYNYGGSAPYSEPETQYIDAVMAEYPDAVAFVSCHNNDYSTYYGSHVIWASSATYHMCNVAFRLVDKMTKAWLDKYGQTLKASIDQYKINMDANDYRLGRATMSTSKGTEQLNATKYGIMGVNLEISRMMKVFSGNTDGTSEVMTHGAEVYANFMRTLLWNYDHKDKKEYAPNLPWSE